MTPPNLLTFGIGFFDATYKVRVHINGQNIVVAINDALGKAACHPDDTFDIRAGVPLALKRALKLCVAGEQRQAFRRAFYQMFPQAHPHYKTCKDHAYPGYRWCVGCVTGKGGAQLRTSTPPPREPPYVPNPQSSRGHDFDTGERGDRWPDTTQPKGTTT